MLRPAASLDIHSVSPGCAVLRHAMLAFGDRACPATTGIPLLQDRGGAVREGTSFRSRGVFSPELCIVVVPPWKSEGAGRAGWPLHPGAPREKVAREREDHRYRRDHTGPPCAVVYGLYVLSSVNLADCHRRPSEACQLRLDLSASLWGARTTRFRRPRMGRTSIGAFPSTALPLHVRDDAYAP